LFVTTILLVGGCSSSKSIAPTGGHAGTDNCDHSWLDNSWHQPGGHDLDDRRNKPDRTVVRVDRVEQPPAVVPGG
jgi:hypothetical protein